MKRKYAFLMMGEHYSPEVNWAEFETDEQITGIYTVKDFESAKAKVLELAEKGFGALQLCGAFQKEKADELIALTGGTIPIGYVVNNPEQDALNAAFFGS